MIGAYLSEGHRLVKIRNPWGSYEWKGDWSDKDKKWTEGMKRELGFSKAEDGVFFMSIEDYQREFGNTTICKVHDDYDLEWIHHSKRDDGNLTKFTLAKGGHMFISVA